MCDALKEMGMLVYVCTNPLPLVADLSSPTEARKLLASGSHYAIEGQKLEAEFKDQLERNAQLVTFVRR